VKFPLFSLLLLLMPALSQAQFFDHDGQLEITWAEPGYGNPLDHYIWSYTINGVTDSITGTSAAGATADSSVTLNEVGHWAVFHIRAVSTVSDTSVVVVSDTAYYNLGTGIGPPTGVTWIQGP
jgi:hypothetical protein